MQVANIMTKKVFTVEADDMIDRAYFLIHYEGIRHLPVVEKGKVIGILSDRDLFKALGPKSNSRAIDVESDANTSVLKMHPKKVRHIMQRGVITVKSDMPASEAAAIMAIKKIGALPVVDKDNTLLGILSATDILRVFSNMDKANESRENKSQSEPNTNKTKKAAVKKPQPAKVKNKSA